MEFYSFHLMPWPYLAPDFVERHRSAWITLSNAEFDPVRGHALYARYLDELAYADALGFDGVCVNEHHQTAYGLMPAPNIIAAILTQRVKRARIAILGNALPLRDHPLRVAEEVAMLDVISGGRIISGFVRGLGCEYHSFSMEATFSRDRFVEAHDLIVRAWTEPGPFEFEGEHYRFRYVNIWPRPLQQPHPPIWLPSTGSIETIEMAVRYGYPFIRVYETAAVVKQLFDEVRAHGEAAGRPVGPEGLGWMVPIYVAETDARALAEAEPHVMYLFRELSHRPFEFLLPPGYASAASMSRALDRLDRRQGYAGRSFRQLVEQGVVVIGSPATVRDRLAAYQREMGFGKLVPLLQFGTLPHELTMQNLELFAREVMPSLRPLGQPAASPARAGTTP
ncbi:MAG: LLM class flavin-dependent oxidoreductase [Chloroflexi bacterium]|nr:LLM class flavin-dependent oxidoreductase [Chloroflexota bacterium]